MTLKCCICDRPSKTIAPGGLLYCGPRGKCSARVFVLYRTTGDGLWAKHCLHAPNATFVCARTAKGERIALRTIRRAKPDTILRISGRGWEKVI